MSEHSYVIFPKDNGGYAYESLDSKKIFKIE